MLNTCPSVRLHEAVFVTRMRRMPPETRGGVDQSLDSVACIPRYFAVGIRPEVDRINLCGLHVGVGPREYAHHIMKTGGYQENTLYFKG